jgi:hypothetical protein
MNSRRFTAQYSRASDRKDSTPLNYGGRLCAAGFRSSLCRLRVKMRSTREEHMFSGLPPTSDVRPRGWHDRRAKTGREQMQQHAVRGRQSYSITSSARASRVVGTLRPMPLLDGRLILEDQAEQEMHVAAVGSAFRRLGSIGSPHLAQLPYVPSDIRFRAASI